VRSYPHSSLLFYTLKEPVEFSGVGIHTGKSSKVLLFPSREGMIRMGCERSSTLFPLSPACVVDTYLSTAVQIGDRIVYTVEHLLSALLGLQVHSVDIVVEGDEIPILDGSSLSFVEEIEPFLLLSSSPPRYITLEERIRVEEGDGWIEIAPSPYLTVDLTIEFSHPAVGIQRYIYRHSTENYRKEIAPARTFGFLKDVERIWKEGRGKGGSLQNALLLDEKSVINPEGLRLPQEFVRHKILDLLGDFYLLNAFPLLSVRGYKSGHSLHRKVVQKIQERVGNLC
jgi:UDP-3-O-[3-hydroxymyristoyl] N-acetylglucosamine deacetylase